MKYGLIIPTLNAGKQFEKLLQQINSQTLSTKKLIVDSGSIDETVNFAKRFNFEVITVRKEDFHHGATRQFALEYLLGKSSLDIIIFLTQDILLHDERTLANLVEKLSEDEKIGLSYGRQLPHENATLEAKILRKFNYPTQSKIKTFSDKKFLGIKTATASNSFAAYRVDALRDVGGFPAHVILCEDMYVAAKMLMKGYKIFYDADAQVYHSHNYTFTQEFRRYFDIGVFHSRESWIRENFGSAEGAGKKFIIMKLSTLWKENPLECGESIFRDAGKFFGYRLGMSERFLPKSICKIFSMNKNFWI